MEGAAAAASGGGGAPPPPLLAVVCREEVQPDPVFDLTNWERNVERAVARYCAGAAPPPPLAAPDLLTGVSSDFSSDFSSKSAVERGSGGSLEWEWAGRSSRTASFPQAERARAAWGVLQRPRVSREALDGLAMGGLPEVAELRAPFWKLLLGYLPFERADWGEYLAAQSAVYEALAAAALSAGGAAWAETVDQVAKDVYRTRAETQLFTRPLPRPAWSPPPSPPCRLSPQRLLPPLNADRPRTHADVLGRILLVYAKLNPEVQYVQGMNELLAPLYYVFFADSWGGGAECGEPRLQRQAEADAFFCLQLLLQRLSLDRAFSAVPGRRQLGVCARVEHFAGLLRRKLPEVSAHFAALGLDVQFFALRWILLLLTQELDLPSTLRLFDTLLADRAVDLASPVLENWVLYGVCLAIVAQLRPRLLAASFCDCVTLMQNLPPLPIERLIADAFAFGEGGARCASEKGP